VELAGPMSRTELEDVQALLERAMSEPRAFAGRLLQQAITQYGPFTEPAATAFYTAVAEDLTTSETIIVPDEWSAGKTPLDTNGLLAAALGACDCWGLRAECRLCQGRGSAGWIQPDPELFEEFVRPAVSRLSATSARGQHPPAKAEQDGSNHQSVQGENA
jgi:hypothetical protein